jgi:hypothetical protein
LVRTALVRTALVRTILVHIVSEDTNKGLPLLVCFDIS